MTKASHPGSREDAEMRVPRVVVPLRQQVADTLRAAILRGRFLPGDRLGERELCDLTGVSRTSVREALRQLEAEGLVETLPNRGPFVSIMDASEAAGLYQVRGVLEALAARMCAEKATPQQVLELRQTVDGLEALVNDGADVQSQHGAISAFYDVMLHAAGNPTLTATLKVIHVRSTRLRLTSIQKPGRISKTCRELRKIVTAIGRRDGDTAAQASIDHIQSAADAALSVIVKSEDVGAVKID